MPGAYILISTHFSLVLFWQVCSDSAMMNVSDHVCKN